MLETTITKVYGPSDKDKAGRLLVTKGGKPYKKIAIQVDYPEYSGKYLSAMAFELDDPVLEVKQGQTLKIIVTPSPDGQYLNFKLPSRLDLLEERVSKLEKGQAWLVRELAKEEEPNKQKPPF